MKAHLIFKDIKAFTFLIALSAFVSSCTEKIDIKLDEGYTRLIVEGTITTDTTAHAISLSHTTSYYYSEPAPRVSGATVTLNDGETEFTLAETEPGIYKTPNDFAGIPGRTYRLNITLASPIGGEDTYSASSYMYPGIALDSIKAAFREDWGEEGFYEVQCYVLDPPSTDFYQFRIYKNDILITDTLSKVLVTDDRFYNGNYTNGIGIGFLDQSKPNEKVLAGDRLSVQTSRITEEYYNFVTELQIQSGYQSPLFSGPPANVKGNISGGAIGFFAAYPVSYSHTKVVAF
jgi:hypothetical protein